MKKRLLVVALVALFVMSMVSPAFATPLIVNGGFESGNTGFTSDYTYLVGSFKTMYDPFMYVIGADPNSFHSSWASFGPYEGAEMMIVNAAHDGGNPGAIVWSETVNLPAAYGTVSTYPLYAGQNWLVGSVLVKNDGSKVCVKFVLDKGVVDDHFRITEAHVAVASSSGGIPKNKLGSPVPGQFPVNVKFDPGVSEAGWYCLPLPAGSPLAVAAHAVVSRPLKTHPVFHDFCVTSGTRTELLAGGNAALSAGGEPLWVPWSSGLDDTFAHSPNWIWDGNGFTDDAAGSGAIVDFKDSFDIVGTPKTASLKIAADNAFAFKVNTGAEQLANLAAGFRTAPNLNPGAVVLNPMQASGIYYGGYPSGQGFAGTYYGWGWGHVYEYPVLADLHAGANTLNVTGVNATWDVPQWYFVNPGGVIYELCGTSEETIVDYTARTETAWGGTNAFLGANWAKYISYTPATASGNYHFSMFGASSYRDAPAELEVKINGALVDSKTLSTTPGYWTEIGGDLNAGTASQAVIVVRDRTGEYNGDDFCIDDISLVPIP